MNCPKCGNNNPDGTGYCIYCGSAMAQAPVPQPPYAQPYSYAPPQPAAAPYDPYRRDETVTMGEWFVFFLVMCIPLVNLIMLFVWGFGSGTKPSKANLCKLQLLLYAIGIVIVLIIGFAVGWAFFDIFRYMW